MVNDLKVKLEEFLNEIAQFLIRPCFEVEIFEWLMVGDDYRIADQ